MTTYDYTARWTDLEIVGRGARYRDLADIEATLDVEPYRGGRYALIEQHASGRVYVSDHAGPASAASYNAGQEEAGSWWPETLVDLDTGETYAGEQTVTTTFDGLAAPSPDDDPEATARYHAALYRLPGDEGGEEDVEPEWLTCPYCGEPAVEEGGCDDCYDKRAAAWGRFHYEGAPAPKSSRDYCIDCGADIGERNKRPPGRRCTPCGVRALADTRGTTP